jgi:hypothetical protein
MDHNMIFTLGCRRQQNQLCKKYTYFLGNFGGHADAAVQCRVHCLMDHIKGFTRSYWMLSLGECLRCITPAATMVINFE